MKNTKRARRAAAFAAAVVMAACAAVPMGSSFSASAVGTGKITITDTSGATSSTMAAFQIFTAQVSGDGNSVVVTGWGDGIDLNALSTAIKASELNNDFSGVDFENTEVSAQKVADIVSGYTGNDATKAETFARLAAQSKKGDGKAAVESVIDGLDTGYYIVIDTKAASNGNYTSFTLGMLTVVTGGNATATVKRDFPSFDKQIGDINDTNDAKDTYTFNEAADHDMGDAVPFKLIASVPSNIAKYDTYKMIFHDDLQKDVFTFNQSSVKVKYYASSSDTTGTNVTESFITALSTTEDKSKFESHTDGTEDFTVTCNNIKGIEGITLSGDGHFEIQYTATLTDKAKMGAEGNWNGAYLEYSNNPNVSGEGDTGNTGKSPTDYCVAFTYQTVIDKIDGITKAPLAGAEFTLKKKLEDGSTKDISVVKASEGTRFMFNGLDDGTYVLEETTVPDNYNGIQQIEFTISAAEIQKDGSEALESLKADGGANATFETGKVYLTDGTTDPSAGADKGSVKTTIENLKGSSLPSTGGIGTTMFYVGGGVLVAGAGVLLITKKRAKKDAE